MYIDLNRIEFVITNACIGKCKHCSAGEHISSGGVVNADAAINAIKWLAERFKIKSVMTFGGEPLLYAETVCKYTQQLETAALQGGKLSQTAISRAMSRR